MAKALTFRQMARNFEFQSVAFGRLAKLQYQAARDMPQSGTATADELKAAIKMYDNAVTSFYTADGADAQALAYHAQADAAGEPA